VAPSLEQVHVSDTVTGTSGRPQVRQAPLRDSVTAVCTGHIQAASTRTGTSGSLQTGQAPGFDSGSFGRRVGDAEITQEKFELRLGFEP
jgi:hypothetical protein